MGSQPKPPELLEIPGAEGVSVDFFNNLLSQPAPVQNVPDAPTIPALNVGEPQQIPLQGVAGLTANEQTVQQLLTQFLASDPTSGEAYQLGMGEIKKTLGGEFYDPKTSDFWKGYRETSAMEQEKGVADIRRRGQLGGGLYATPNQRTEADYIKGMGARRTMMLGGLFEKERDRKTNAVGQALGYAGFGEKAKTDRLTIGSAVGAIPRIAENQKLEALFNQAFGQSQADFAQQQLQNQATYTQAIGQTQVDYEAQQAQSGADYASQLFPYTYQAPMAAALMPQWNIDQGGGESPLGGILGLIGTLATAGK